jgi:hypothetical protein
MVPADGNCLSLQAVSRVTAVCLLLLGGRNAGEEYNMCNRLRTVGPSRCAADSTARVYDQAFNISSFIGFIAGQPALHVGRLIICYTLWESIKAMEQAFLPIIEANRKGNLKSGWIYLL